MPALLLCCGYASGMFPNVAPSSWHPIQIAPDSHLGAPVGSRCMGVALPGNSLQTWSTATGVRPCMLMSFEQWYDSQLPGEKLAEDQAVGIHAEMFTWEPWKPKPYSSHILVQGAIQKGITDREIADGRWDGYITSWAQDVAKYPHITVYIRFAHEMNGTWYPWNHHPRAYIAMWKHVVGIFRKLDVKNARFVWSASVGMGIPRSRWEPHMRTYWPGRKYVSVVGATVINFGGTGHTHSARQFEPRLATMHRVFGKPVMLTEVDTQYKGRAGWIHDLANYVATTRWIKAVVWSQLLSRGQHDMQTGNMGWQVAGDSTQVLQAFRQLAAAAAKTLPSTTGITATVGGGS